MEDAEAKADLQTQDGEAVLHLQGDWSIKGDLPDAAALGDQIRSSDARRVTFESEGLGKWDSSLLIFLLGLERRIAGEDEEQAEDEAADRDREKASAQQPAVEIDKSGLPEGVRSLIALAAAVPEREGARGTAEKLSFLGRLGKLATAAWAGNMEMVEFLGQITLAFGAWTRGRARFRYSDLFQFIQEAGVEALPIVSLISFLVGLILAFVGAVQLEQFGAEIYVANLVGISMVREMGALMTAIVMAGRTGAAYAAQLGSMKVNQEIDALTTMGISPLEFLVLPRVMALATMMPLLALYSNLVGILGGATVSILMLGMSGQTYYNQTTNAVTLPMLFGGVFKASVYGILVALSGCLRGMQSGKSSSAVGEATTRAVVTSIVAIISACGVFAVVFYVLGI
ncbi:MAG TPA: ABC transporter permease [Candidatus Limnocylindrales bacterium]|nr:ABC transporter permease [Candidatus Limnocylindrales bacterium]